MAMALLKNAGVPIRPAPGAAFREPVKPGFPEAIETDKSRDFAAGYPLDSAPARGLEASRVLLADDDPVSLRMLESLISKWGYQTLAARNGKAAWDLLTGDEHPRLAVLDWEMPGMDGVEVVERLRARKNPEGAYTYVILLTRRSGKDSVVGGIRAGADDYVTKPYDPQELKVRLRAGQRIVSLQQELVASREAMRLMAMMDPLTGILNRGAVMECLSSEIARAERFQTPLSVAMLDLDHFKDVNDAFGHPAGDAVLQGLVKRVRGATRGYDFVGRYGGEEFLVIAPGAGVESRHCIFERIRNAVGSLPMEHQGQPIPVTVSLGVATWKPGESKTDLIDRADKALYRAKEEGRDRVVISPDPR